MTFTIGKKIGMTRVFNDDGTVVPVTVIQTELLKATQVRTKEKDGYEATQFSYGTAKKQHKKEFKVTAAVGDEVSVAAFKAGDVVKIAGLSKAKGFQGAVKRHGFAGLPASHGHHHVMRHVGSIGQRFPQHTLKGSRGPGRMGGKQITTRGLKVVSVDAEHSILVVKGAVPGRRGTVLTISTI